MTIGKGLANNLNKLPTKPGAELRNDDFAVKATPLLGYSYSDKVIIKSL